jgi:hypothetical protein
MRVGKRILFALEMCETLGTITSSHLLKEWADQHQTNCHKYLSRAVGLRLMTVDRTTYPHTFSLVDDWRERVYGKKPRAYVRKTEEVKQVRGKSSVFAGANSIFNLAA